MKPIIYKITAPHTETGDKLPGQAYLVDASCVFIAEDSHGHPRRYYAAAVDLGDKTAGKFEMLTRKGPPPQSFQLLHPRPCLLEVFKGIGDKSGSIEAWPPQKWGVLPEAARALLLLAAAHTNAMPNMAACKWELGKPIKTGVAIPWDEHKFMAAWLWSEWKKCNLSGTQRHEQMRMLGYERTSGALRKICSEMGLVTFRRTRS